MNDAVEATKVLENAAFKKAVEEYSKQLVTVWSASEKLEEREAAWNQQRALTSVVNHLQGFIEKENYKLRVGK